MIGYRFIPAAVLVLLLISAVRIYSQCSIVSIEGPDTIRPNEILKLSAKLAPEVPNPPEFKWETSVGTFTSGPTGPTVFVDTTGLGGQSITATVKVIGVGTRCSTEASLVTRVEGVVGCGLAFDDYGDISFTDEKARLDNFAIQVQTFPDSRAFLIAYAGRRTYPNEAAERLKRAKNYLTNVRHIKPERIITVDGGHRGELEVLMWVVPPGASLPEADPSGIIAVDKLDFSKPRPKVTRRSKNR